MGRWKERDPHDRNTFRIKKHRGKGQNLSPVAGQPRTSEGDVDVDGFLSFMNQTPSLGLGDKPKPK